MFTTRNLIVAALAGVAGCIANSIAISLTLGAPLLTLIFSLGREFFSILFALALIPIFANLSGVAAWAVAFVVLNALASLSAKLVFGADVAWVLVLVFNGIYALAATAVYVGGRRAGHASA